MGSVHPKNPSAKEALGKLFGLLSVESNRRLVITRQQVGLLCARVCLPRVSSCAIFRHAHKTHAERQRVYMVKFRTKNDRGQHARVLSRGRLSRCAWPGRRVSCVTTHPAAEVQVRPVQAQPRPAALALRQAPGLDPHGKTLQVPPAECSNRKARSDSRTAVRTRRGPASQRIRDLTMLAHLTRLPVSASVTAIVSLCTSRPT